MHRFLDMFSAEVTTKCRYRGSSSGRKALETATGCHRTGAALPITVSHQVVGSIDITSSAAAIISCRTNGITYRFQPRFSGGFARWQSRIPAVLDGARIDVSLTRITINIVKGGGDHSFAVIEWCGAGEVFHWRWCANAANPEDEGPPDSWQVVALRFRSADRLEPSPEVQWYRTHSHGTSPAASGEQ